MKKDKTLQLQSIIETSLKDHFDLIQSIMDDRILSANLEKIATIITESLNRGGKLLMCGNGGSAADSQHLATELVSKFLRERKALDAEALTVNTSVLTAIGNDYSFDKVFSRQVEAKIRPGDVLLGISTSGNSSNVVNAVQVANEMGGITICMIGGNAHCALANIANHCIMIPSLSTPRIQEAHILIGHILCQIIEMIL